MIILIGAERQHAFLIETLSKLGIEEKFLNLINGIYEKSTVNIFNGERMNNFSLRLGIRQRHLLLTLLTPFQRYTGDSTQSDKAKKKKKK